MAKEPAARATEQTGQKLGEFEASLDATVNVDARYRRVVATAEQAHAYYHRFEPPAEHQVELIAFDYGKLRVVVASDVIVKMFGWVTERSQGYTLEVQGRFLGKRRPDHLLVNDFVPMPSFCQSLAYETTGADDRIKRFGGARVRSIGLDDWKPEATQFYRDAGVFSDSLEIPIDPLAVAIPFHSHYLKSTYQRGPSPGDYDHIFHIKWLYAPRSGHNILYSGISPFQVIIPYDLPAQDTDDEPLAWVGTLNNPEDCEVWVAGTERGHAIPLGDGITIGRDPACTITLDDNEASRQHARILWDDDGQLVIQDLESRNGTLYRGERVDRLVVEEPLDFVIGDTTLSIRF